MSDSHRTNHPRRSPLDSPSSHPATPTAEAIARADSRFINLCQQRLLNPHLTVKDDWRYLRHRLFDWKAHEIEAHLAACQTCAQKMRRLNRLLSFLKLCSLKSLKSQISNLSILHPLSSILLPLWAVTALAQPVPPNPRTAAPPSLASPQPFPPGMDNPFATPVGYRLVTNVVLEPIPAAPQHYYAITPDGGVSRIGLCATDAEALQKRNTGTQQFVNGHDVIFCSEHFIDPHTLRIVWQFKPGFHTRSPISNLKSQIPPPLPPGLASQ